MSRLSGPALTSAGVKFAHGFDQALALAKADRADDWAGTPGYSAIMWMVSGAPVSPDSGCG